MSKSFIVLGDTTTHGGTICEGEPLLSIDGAATVLTGHRFDCPKCGVEAMLIGTSPVSVLGRSRVLEGDEATCGAIALHYGSAVSESFYK